MSEYDDDMDAYVASDFYSIVGDAQLNELKEVEKAREKEREDWRILQEKQKNPSLTLAQVAGLKSAREMEQLLDEKNTRDDAKLVDEAKQRKAEEKARLENRFPPPEL